MWKFFHNGDGWWLRIESLEQLEEYLKRDSSIAAAFSDILLVKMQKQHHSTNPISDAIQLIANKDRSSMFTAANSLAYLRNKTYIDNLLENGFVNINCNGGCNACDWKMLLVEERERLVFPHYSMSDVRIKTWKPQYGAESSDYRYHYYCYLGNQQLTDGDKVKWDTEAEAREFVKKFLEIQDNESVVS